MTIRILESQWAPFTEALCARRDVESAGIVLAERLQGDRVLLARHLLPVSDDGYVIRRSDQLRIAPLALNRLIRPARDGAMSVLTVHTHPRSNRPWFSMADDAGDSRLMPSLFVQTPGPHGSIVIAGDTRESAARLWSKRGTTVDSVLRIVGKTIRTHTMEPTKPCERWFDRQVLALGDAGQRVLRNLHVAIVGLGGTGSVAFVQLVHLGVGRITIIDGDRVEHSNVSRIIGATACDAGVTRKVDVAARYAASLGLGTHVEVIHGHLGAEVSVADIEGLRHCALMCGPSPAARAAEPPRLCKGDPRCRHGQCFSRRHVRPYYGRRRPSGHCRPGSPLLRMLGPHRSGSSPDRVAVGGGTG